MKKEYFVVFVNSLGNYILALTTLLIYMSLFLLASLSRWNLKFERSHLKAEECTAVEWEATNKKWENLKLISWVFNILRKEGNNAVIKATERLFLTSVRDVFCVYLDKFIDRWQRNWGREAFLFVAVSYQYSSSSLLSLCPGSELFLGH